MRCIIPAVFVRRREERYGRFFDSVAVPDHIQVSVAAYLFVESSK